MGNLVALLTDVQSEAATDRPFVWPTTGTRTTVRAAIGPLSSSGLITTTDRGTGARLTTEAAWFLRDGDVGFLIALFHAHSRFIGEILGLLGSTKMTHRSLNDTAESQFGLRWTTLDQIRRRTTWLRATGMVEVWKGSTALRITPSGTALLEKLSLADPQVTPASTALSSDTAVLDPPGPALAEELRLLDQQRLARRNPRIGYLAGGTRAESVRRLLDAVGLGTNRSGFFAFCQDTFGVEKTSAVQTLQTLLALGMIEQVGNDLFAPTAVALDWMSSDRAVDLIRILHCRVSPMGEIIVPLTEPMTNSEIHEYVRTFLPGVPLRGPGLAQRLKLLREAELVEQIGYLRYRATPLGKKFAESVTTLEPAGTDPGPTADAAGSENMTARAEELRYCAAELVGAGTDSSHPERLENSVERALNLLGATSTRIGGPSATDVLTEFWLSPTETSKVSFEAKTSSAGVVPKKDVDFDGMEQHRQDHGADRIAIVGPGFGGPIPKLARSKQIPLITTALLASWLTRSIRTVLLPSELHRLIFDVDLTDQVSVENHWAAVERRSEAIRLVSQALWESGNDTTDIDFNEGALSVRDLWRALKTNSPVPIDLVGIQQAIDLLSAPAVGGAARVKHEDYAATARPAIIAARLRGLADALESVPLERFRVSDALTPATPAGPAPTRRPGRPVGPGRGRRV
ncbi:hypothetical protein ACFVT9_16650 [Kitasatospora cineracea]|uniref:hypothetical protein n=1 Tax=Kitasatospora cineracea TaxID=88074 RepID=UPI0036D878DF